MNKHKGIAIISVLMVMVIVMGLAGAFLIAHRSDLALMTTGRYQAETENAILSVASYIEYELQNDRTFGTDNFTDQNGAKKDKFFKVQDDKEILIAKYHQATTGGVGGFYGPTITGTLPGSDVSFSVKLLNNLSGDSTRSAGIAGAATTYTTPYHSARAWITTERGSVTKNLDVIFKSSPFTSSSITSGDSIAVDFSKTSGEDGGWILNARQPWGNSVRAKKNITIPDITSSSQKVSFRPAPGELGTKLNPPYGVLQAKNIYTKLGEESSEVKAQDTELIDDIQESMKGTLSYSKADLKIPELDPNDLQSVAYSLTPKYSELIFKTTEGGKTALYAKGSNNPLQTYDAADSTGRIYYLPSAGDSPLSALATVDLATRTVKVADGIELKVGEGNFSLASELPGDDQKVDPNNQPTLILGSGGKGSSINATNINIEGSVGGLGALKANGGNLSIKARSNLSTIPDYGVALYADKDVTIGKPGVNISDALPVDWDAFKIGITTNIENTDFTTDLNGWMKLDPTDTVDHENLGEEAPVDDPDTTSQEELAKTITNTAIDSAKFNVLWGDLKNSDFEVPADVLAKVEQIKDTWSKEELTIDKYIRLREFLRTKDSRWLPTDEPPNPDTVSHEIYDIVKSQLTAYQIAAGQSSSKVDGQVVVSWNSLAGFFSTATNPYKVKFEHDMSFRGLVYTKGQFTFDAGGLGIYIEGALVAAKNINVINATGASFMYNADLLAKLFAAKEGDNSVPLERAYWANY